MTGEREPWERQFGESRQAFEAFAKYRDMGSARSTAKVSRELGKTKALMDRWSARWNWVFRADAWDEELDRQGREKQEQERKEMAERHAKEAMLFQQKMLTRLNELKPGELSPQDLARWFDISVKVERLARGESTEISKVKHEGGLDLHQVPMDLSKLTDEELMQLEQLVGKASEQAGDSGGKGPAQPR